MFIETKDGLRARICHETGLTQVSNLPFTAFVIFPKISQSLLLCKTEKIVVTSGCYES